MVANIDSFSPSAAKPGLVVASWRQQGFPIRIIEPPALPRADFCRAHDRGYVDDILDLRASNGFGNRSAEVAHSLLFTSGAMLAATREAIRNSRVACAPCSGFHHAGHEYGVGFCTFNGLMVAALALKAEGLAARVGILDCDEHYGDGTDDILFRLKPAGIMHWSAGARYHRPSQARRFLDELPRIVESFSGCDVLLYQAGADPHVDDPLGGWLSTEELARRDRLVFGAARRIGLPVAWNLAGGYQTPLRKVLDIHDNTMKACVNTYLEE